MVVATDEADGIGYCNPVRRIKVSLVFQSVSAGVGWPTESDLVCGRGGDLQRGRETGIRQGELGAQEAIPEIKRRLSSAGIVLKQTPEIQ